MDGETNQNVQVENEEESRPTPDRPLFSPLVPKINEENETINDLNNTGIKTVPPDIERNSANLGTQIADTCVQLQGVEVPEKLPAENKSSTETETIISDVSEVQVKDEPGIDVANATDYDMPLAKTLAKHSINEPPDIERNSANLETQIAGTCVQLKEVEVAEKLPAENKSSTETETIISDVSDVQVKNEPGIDVANAIDYDMPLAKTPAKHSIDEPPDIERNSANLETLIADTCVQLQGVEVPEKLPAENKSSTETDTIISDVSEVQVKDEPGIDVANAIDYDMPLAKTPAKHSIDDIETSSLAANYATIETQKENTNEMQNETHSNNANDSNSTYLRETAAKSAFDAYLDGIATPIAPVRPRLRVKTEFALIPPKTPQRESVADMLTLNKDCQNMETDFSPPPPPPLISSISNTDFLIDGITTPRISLAAINRLRVKSEYSLPPATPQHYNEDESSMPEDFFDDLLENRDYKKEAGEVSLSNSEEPSEDEHIPEDFFDDLLRDNAKERVEEAQNNELEEKYSDRLKELKRMKDKSREKRKNRKKQKKSKKKSRKRSRSRSLSPSNSAKDRHFNDLEITTSHTEIKRSRASPPSRREMLSTVHVVNKAVAANSFLREDKGIRIKSEFPTNDIGNVTIEECTTIVENVEEIEEVLTPKQKRERAVKRAAALLNHLKDSTTSKDNSTIFSTFPFVSTVRKLPTSHSYVQQQIYENRSPLHTVNNVSYKFNSHTTRFNMEEWGLAALSTHAAKMAKLVGCDAQFIHTKLKTIKIPAKLKKIKQELGGSLEENEEEDLQESTSSLYCHAMTQTDDICEFNRLLKTKVNEIGVQVEPSVYSIGSQTLETQSPKEVCLEDDAPIMKIIRDLNENQLMAIHQFAELIREPNTSSSAIEMYKRQMQIMDIYKISQIPSALALPQTLSLNSYTTTTTNSPPKHRAAGYRQREYEQQEIQQQPIIQSVRGADGTQFSINDPRSRSAAYAKRTVNDGAGSSSNYDHRYSAQGRSSPNQGYSYISQARYSGSEDRPYTSSNNSRTSCPYPLNNQASPTSTKFYGRGGLRR